MVLLFFYLSFRSLHILSVFLFFGARLCCLRPFCHFAPFSDLFFLVSGCWFLVVPVAVLVLALVLVLNLVLVLHRCIVLILILLLILVLILVLTEILMLVLRLIRVLLVI